MIWKLVTRKKNQDLKSHQSMKTGTVVMCSDENVIPSTIAIPEFHVYGHIIHSCLHEFRSMSKPWKARLRAKFTRDVDRHEEKIGFVGIQRPDGTFQKNFVNSNLSRK